MANVVNVAVVGAGLVGKDFLAQLAQAKFPFSVIAIRTSSRLLSSADYRPLDLSTWTTDLQRATKPVPNWTEFVDYLARSPAPVILVDNTSDETVAASYPTLLRRGISVATPNKKAFSGAWALWEDMQRTVREGDALLYHESSVGAGLPIISTLKDLVATGDRVLRIEGIFSGTLSYIFNEFSPVVVVNDDKTTTTDDGRNGGGKKFSEVVRVAKESGYTEPDPREDLNGLDVARKLTILSRLCGLRVPGPTSFPVESLIPSELASVTSAEEFMAALPAHDEAFSTRRAAAEKKGAVLRFVGVIDTTTTTPGSGEGGEMGADISVALKEFPATHPFASLRGSDNIVAFYTERYGAQPLIVQGAGAGAAVTAMGVMADVLKIGERVIAKGRAKI